MVVRRIRLGLVLDVAVEGVVLGGCGLKRIAGLWYGFVICSLWGLL